MRLILIQVRVYGKSSLEKVNIELATLHKIFAQLTHTRTILLFFLITKRPNPKITTHTSQLLNKKIRYVSG